MKHRKRMVDVERHQEKKRRRTLRKQKLENKINSNKNVDKVHAYGIHFELTL
jgi:hypothetical protein